MRRVVVGPGEHEVLGHHDVERVAWPDLDRGGDTHATADQFRRDLAQLLPHGSAKDVAGGGPTEAPAEIRDLAQLHAGTDDREEEGAAEHAEQVVVHLVLEASGPAASVPGMPSFRLRLVAFGKITRFHVMRTR